MKTLIAFATALNDPLRIRILALASEHKTSAAELAEALKQSPEAIKAHAKQLLDAHLIKADAKGEALRVKRKHSAVVEALFEHFKVTAKKVPVLRQDAKALKHLRAAKKAAAKPAKKVKVKAKTAKPKAKTK